MIELTWQQAKNQFFRQGFSKVVGTSHDIKTNYHIMRICKLMDQETKIYDDMHLKILEKYNALKPDGSYSVPEEAHTEYKKDMDLLSDTKFVIEKTKINISNLKCELTPIELLALEPMLFGLELVGGGSNGEEEKNS
jgi:hypothetical protein